MIDQMSEHNRPVVIAARRTPISTRGARLSSRSVHELAAPVIRQCLADAEQAIGSSIAVGDVVIGNCMGPGGNIARVSALAADIDVSVPGMTIDRQCGSGLSAIITASDAIRAGDCRLLLAGGLRPDRVPRSGNGSGRPGPGDSLRYRS